MNIDSIQAEGYVYELIARFNEPAKYYLTYGYQSAGKADYDITRFAEKIPKTLSVLQLGDELIIEKAPKPKPTPPLFDQNSVWLVMILIIIILGWFSIKMIRQK